MEYYKTKDILHSGTSLIAYCIFYILIPGKKPILYSVTKYLEYKGIELAEEVRRYVYENCIKPARNRGETEIVLTSGDIHEQMKLNQRMPLVCSVLRGSELQDAFNVILVREIRLPSVKKDSSTNKFVFRIE